VIASMPVSSLYLKSTDHSATPLEHSAKNRNSRHHLRYNFLENLSFRLKSTGGVGEARRPRPYRPKRIAICGKTHAATWRDKPCWYQVSTNDRTINPDLERFLAKRMKATTIELPSSHVSLLSHPREIADLILSAAGHNG
jgi:pimeloyl-ACP methyl ester carboxylesterase